MMYENHFDGSAMVPRLIEDKRMKVLITGGTGFLGRGILRRYASEWDITVYSRDEYKQVLCKDHWPQAKYVLGDVTNYERLCNAMRGHDLVIHTAAVKFIPEAEINVSECIDVNLLGSRMVMEAAAVCGVESVVCISTDKACQPLNVYGMTKALMERLVGEYAAYENGVRYTACRYGNVIGSTGSVIPLFQRQAKEQGSVTITDPHMTRYWISVDQAIDLIQDALATCNSGDIVIPTPAAMRIGDIAALFGVPVTTVGIRPGEKRHEQLLYQQESVRAEYDGKNYILHPQGVYSEPFMLSSNDPKTWLSCDQMLAHIQDALSV